MNYPSGAYPNSPDAPWNDSDDEFEADHIGICEKCDNGQLELNSDEICHDCYAKEVLSN